MEWKIKYLEKVAKYESFKLWVFSKIEDLIKNNKLSAKKLSLICNKSVKQCKRYIESYRHKNFFYKHGNKNTISKKAICENIKKEIVDLYISIQEKLIHLEKIQTIECLISCFTINMSKTTLI